MIYFITGNSGKLNEVKGIIPDVVGIDLDLPEVQSLDPEKIITEKLKEAVHEKNGEYFVEDTSLYFDCLNGFPGPLIKLLLERIGNAGIYSLVNKYQNYNAVAKTVIGYSDGKDVHFFVGELNGKIVAPRGQDGFGWDAIFEVNGKTLAEMSTKEKNRISMRRDALIKLKYFLEKHG